MELKDFLKVGKTTCYALIGMRGRVGDFVYRRLKSGTYISRRPKKPSSQTAGTRRGMERFRLATEFAKKEMKDPVRKASYKEIAEKSVPYMRNAYTAAIKEYMNRPETVVGERKAQQKIVVEKPILKNRKQMHPYRALTNRRPVKRSDSEIRSVSVGNPELRTLPWEINYLVNKQSAEKSAHQ